MTTPRRPAAPRAPGRPDSSAPVGVQMFGWWSVDAPDQYVVVALWWEMKRASVYSVPRHELDAAVSLDALWRHVHMQLIGDL